ncbi:MAG: glycosyltransferase family 2 protein [Lachnospiraceae bacterium]|nr:glycosyltransferase family 2 protein [Lachnospiraceae bacterium]
MISVIVPIYNVEAYLPRCVDSLRMQTYADLEMILVDDGSTDRCGEICDAYAETDPRIRVVHKENGGLSDARNAGLQIASGGLIAFVDSDDWVSKDFLQRLYGALMQTGADICECGVVRTSGEAEEPQASGTEAPEKKDMSAKTEPVCFGTEDALRELIHDGVFHQTVWNKLYRRPCPDGILFEKGKTNEDEFWTYQVFGRAKKIAKIDDALYCYFQRPGSIMGTSYGLKRLDSLEAKAGRQTYIEKNFPALAGDARRSLIASCLYAGQMSLKNLRGEEQRKAREIIDGVRDRFPLGKADLAGMGLKSGLWLRLSRLSFWGTVRVKNLLKKGF